MKDTELQQYVIDELAWRPDLNPSQIGVMADNGVVTLTGYVPSFAAKYEAEQAAKSVSGVRGVVEHLKVRYGEEDRTSDDDIARRALSSLKWSALIPDGVKVTVEDGWVTLSGQVTWQFERNAAESAVRALTGVLGVTNNIALKAQPQSDDVKSRIEAALKRSAEIDSNAIDVSVSDGTVTLEGTVDSWMERQAAESAAWAAPGVKNVQDRLTII